jgi:short-subunit dehydrogenase
MKAALPQMRTQKSGLIIITSIAGYMGLPYRSIYSASKALELITEALRMEVKSFGIHITNVAP